MYEAFFEMTSTPFARNIPPEQLYENRSLREILGRLMYVADRKLFAVVTSDPGCGKSTLLRRFEAMLPKEKYILLYLSDSKLTPKWFYKGLLEQLIIPAFESHRIRYAEPPNPSGGAMRNQIPFRCSEPYPTMNLRQLCRTH